MRRERQAPAECCRIAKPAHPADAGVYRQIRDIIIAEHCGNRGRDHPCAGVITITAKHITFNCRLCGDARQAIGEADR